MKKICMSLNEKLIEKIDAEAEKIGVNRTSCMNFIIFDYFQKKDNMDNAIILSSTLEKFDMKGKNA